MRRSTVRGRERADNEVTSSRSETRREKRKHGARKRDRSCSEARQEVGVRWNSAKVGEPGKGGSRPLRLRGSICKKEEEKKDIVVVVDDNYDRPLRAEAKTWEFERLLTRDEKLYFSNEFFLFLFTIGDLIVIDVWNCETLFFWKIVIVEKK